LGGITGRIVVEIGAPIIAMRQTQTQAQAELAAAAAVLRLGWDAEAEEGEDEEGSFHGRFINVWHAGASFWLIYATVFEQPPA